MNIAKSKLIEVFGCKADFLRESGLSCENLTQQTDVSIKIIHLQSLLNSNLPRFFLPQYPYYVQEKSSSSILKCFD